MYDDRDNQGPPKLEKPGSGHNACCWGCLQHQCRLGGQLQEQVVPLALALGSLADLAHHCLNKDELVAFTTKGHVAVLPAVQW
ncbi:hypothetical protein HaLaN_25324 [Haematococcus lacustris]|uniref:Uncharacterized protein n=1 Tax=Haematococcus lacustris TaxID=44745 RepID=A0A699ZYF0_HAELA|nr:hypothetical protein HaLaN_25324 [Haematococcus lacustris]